MADPVPFSRPINWEKLRADEAERLIHQRASTTSNVIITAHAFDRIQGREIVQTDVYRILQMGQVDGDPMRNERGEWQALVVRRMPGTRFAGAVTVIVRSTDDLIVRTVMWVDH